MDMMELRSGAETVPQRSPSPVCLEPFVHQVGGHFPMVCLDETTVCKPLNDREHKFYKSLPSMLKPFAPTYEGTMRVETVEDEDGYITIRGQPPPSHRKVSQQQQTSSTTSTTPHYRLKRNESLEIEKVDGSSFAEIYSKSLPSASFAVALMDEDMNSDFSERKSSEGGSSSVAGEEGIFYNPWALKCHSHHLKKLGLLRPASSSGGDHEGEAGRRSQQLKPQMYLLLENLVSKYRHPCILDLKVGTRQYADDVSTAKKQRKIAKVANTTSSTLGVRLCGMQVYNAATAHYTCHNKYFGRSLSPEAFKRTIEEFFNNGFELRTDVITSLIDRLVELGRILEILDSYRFYTSSLLVTYDGSFSNPNSDQENVPRTADLVDVRIIDFAHSTHKGLRDSVLHSGPDEGFIFGLKNFVNILKEIGDGIATRTDGQDSNNQPRDDN